MMAGSAPLAIDPAVEWNLILGEAPGNAHPEAQSEGVVQLLKLVVAGQYCEVLRSEAARSLFGSDHAESSDEDVKKLVETHDAQAYLETRLRAERSAKPTHERQLEILCIGVASLYVFMQNGWTGPPLEIEGADILPEACRAAKSELRAKAMQSLVEDGEEVYALTTAPLFLVFALAIFGSASSFSDVKSASWWRARSLLMQQKILDNPADSLRTAIYEAMEAQTADLPPLESWRQLHARFNLEKGLVFHWYQENTKPQESFKAAQEASNFQWTLSGALGRRTKFQEFDVSHLVVLAESAPDNDNAAAGGDVAATPQTLALNDDTMLETVAFKETGSDGVPKQKNLSVIDQCILLAYCLNVKNMNPQDGLTTEEMVPYVRRVLENANNWMVHTMALLLRTRLEGHKSRTVERSCLQLQALVDQFPLEESTPAERMLYVFSIELPPKWEMERELGERFVSLGATRSALDIFERLEMWEDAISCYQMMEQPKKAEAIIEARLKVTPRSPKLHCLLGDIRADPSYYELAWSLSEGRYARAMRSLGAHYFKLGEWVKAIECYHRALAINSLFENSWFVMGCAAMRAEDWDQAVRAFSRVTSLDHENGEAWNNLASVYVRQKKKREAWRALREAIKQHYDNSKIWENYMFISTDLGKFQEAMHAMERVLENRWDKAGETSQVVDVGVLEILVDAVTAPEMKDASGHPAANHAPRLSQLLNSITAKVGTNPGVFACAARLAAYRGAFRKSLDCRLKAYRCMLHHPRMATDEGTFRMTVQRALELVLAYIEIGPKMEAPRMAETEEQTSDGMATEQGNVVCKDWAYQARMTLKTLIGRTKNNFEDTPLHDSLKQRLEEVTALTQA
ncbi:hypothetical protein HDU86_004294 [Geranomyces michiganensis]|nr:hypothetical protein HDU86_004294 [Geranomyces michiganensis]